jgi:AAA15 family ATPase/GTPase
LNQFDLAISDIQIIKADLQLPGNMPSHTKARFLTQINYKILVFHKSLSTTTYPIEYTQLSSGTRKLFDLSILLHTLIHEGLHRNLTMVFDEFESSFHPHIVKKLYNLIVNKAGSKSQLIVTTHSPTLLDLDVVRRDQVWFVEKNGELASELYSLVDFAPTVNDNIAKGWMQGRYGAVPYIEWEQ